MFVYVLTTVRGEDYEGYHIYYQRVFKTLRGAKEELRKRFEKDTKEIEQTWRESCDGDLEDTSYSIACGCEYYEGYIDKKKLGE